MSADKPGATPPALLVDPSGQPVSSELLDPTGTPVQTDPPPDAPPKPEEWIPPVTFRDRFRQYVSRALTPEKLAEICDMADIGQPSWLVELEEEILEKDLKIGSVFQLRSAAVLSTAYTIMPADKSDEARRIADFITEAMKLTNLQDAIATALECIAFPFAVSHIQWTVRELTVNGKTALANVPVLFKRIPQRHFRWSYYDDQLLYMADLARPDLAQPMAPYTTVRSIYQARRDHPTRSGLMRAIVWLYLFKNSALKDWVSWLNRYGMPTRIAKVPRDDFKNTEIFNRLRRAMRTLGTEGSAVIPADADLLLEAAASGNQSAHQVLIDKFDVWIAQGVLGHELSSQSTRTGNYGVSAAKEVRADIAAGDCLMVAGDFKRDVFVPMTGWNFGWDKIQLAPTIGYRYEMPSDQKAVADMFCALGERFPGLTFSKAQFREIFNIRAPEGVDESADDVLRPAPPPQKQQPDQGPRRLPAARFRHMARLAGTRRTSRDLEGLIARGEADSEKELLAMRAPIKGLIARAAREEWPVARIRRELGQLYPELDLSTVRENVAQTLALGRLYGRTVGRG